MKGRHIFYLAFCALLFFSCDKNAGASPNSIELDSLANTDNDQALPYVANSTLQRNTKTSNFSELFAKVLELEDQIRKLNGDLQREGHERALLASKLDGLYQVGANATSPVTTASSNQSQKNKSSYLTTITQAVEMINAGKNSEAIKLLDTHLQKSKTAKKSPGDEGELYYWLAKAYSNEKRLDKAAHYFAKSYRYNVDVRPNNILVGLIDTLALDGQYKQICPLLSKLDTKYLASLNEAKRNKINSLKKSHCSSSTPSVPISPVSLTTR